MYQSALNTNEIKNIVENRNIEYLVHFTREENLYSILKHGIHSVDSARKNNIKISVTDENRWDRNLNSISTSISFPNYKMFFSKRRALAGSWAVIILSPEVLWEKSCLFYKHNAASMRMHGQVDFSSPYYFGSMFEKISQNSKGQHVDRNYLQLPNNMTTDPQAEVMIYSHIAQQYIKDIYFSSEQEQTKYAEKILQMNLNIQTHFFPTFYNPRKDYRYWQ